METVLLILAVLGGCTAILIGYEKRMVYYPSVYPDGIWDTEPLGIQDVYFSSGDGVKLHGWFVPAEGAAATVLWFHGNAGNLTHRLSNIIRLRALGLNVFIFDYRGYGKSEGKPDEPGIYRDSLAAYEVLVRVKKVSPERLFLFGRSLGGVCAIEVASQRPAAGLILESTFTSAKDMARNMFPFLPLGYFIRSRFDAIGKIAALKIPKLILHGTEDEIVPYRMGKELYRAAAEPKAFYEIQGAGHNDTYLAGGESYFATLRRFVRHSLAAAAPAGRSTEKP